MRLLINLKARRDAEYPSRYHNNVRGKIWETLRDTPVEELHNTSKIPKFAFSNVFPTTERYSEGDEAQILISSPHYQVVDVLENELQKDSEFNIGETPFDINFVSRISPDPGQVGDKGVLKCQSGIHLSLDETHRNEHNITGYGDSSEISWTPKHSLELFYERFIDNLQWKVQTTQPDYVEQPTEFNEVLDSINFGNTYPVELPVSSEPDSFRKMFVVTQFTADYTIRDQNHKRWLETLLDSGSGWRNTLGFGFMNIQ